MKYCHKLLISVVGLGFFNYAVLWKRDIFYFLETFILGPLFQLDCCHSVLTRHDTLSQNDVFTQNSILRAIIEVSGGNQTHPKIYRHAWQKQHQEHLPSSYRHNRCHNFYNHHCFHSYHRLHYPFYIKHIKSWIFHITLTHLPAL